MSSQAPHIVIAGASGYIGRTLIPRLLERFPEAKITALSRSRRRDDDRRVTWQVCDLFSLKSLEDALTRDGPVDVAFYMVHSMAPTAQLDQGSFSDYDLILADNFARIVKKSQIQQVIYLGGLIPDRKKNLSQHLRSRLEVEQTFRAHDLPTVVFRAGLIIGPGGSSWEILRKLVERLPVMIGPSWLAHRTTPVDLATVEKALSSAVLNPEYPPGTYDLASCRPLSYIDMMKATAEKLGLKRRIGTTSLIGPRIARIWVSLITGSPKELVYPLIESLQYDMLSHGPEHERSFSQLLDQTPLLEHKEASLHRFRVERQTVRSVQRLPLPPGYNAETIKLEYAHWLPRFFRTGMKVSTENGLIIFTVFGIDLLELKLSADRSDKDRQLLYIKKGFLVAENERGRLEFRVVLKRKYVLAAIHDYKPSLPWFIYRFTQARVHLFVMRAFARHLVRGISA